MEIEYPPLLTGTPEEQLQQIREYLCRLADTLRTFDPILSLIRLDAGTGVEFGDQFIALKNMIEKINEGGNDGKE